MVLHHGCVPVWFTSRCSPWKRSVVIRPSVNLHLVSCQLINGSHLLSQMENTAWLCWWAPRCSSMPEPIYELRSSQKNPTGVTTVSLSVAPSPRQDDTGTSWFIIMFGCVAEDRASLRLSREAISADVQFFRAKQTSSVVSSSSTSVKPQLSEDSL